MTRIVIDLDLSADAVNDELRIHAKLCPTGDENCYLHKLADIVEAAADKRYVVLDIDELGVGVPMDSNDDDAVLEEFALQLDKLPPRNPDVQRLLDTTRRVLDVAAETGTDLSYEDAQRIANALQRLDDAS